MQGRHATRSFQVRLLRRFVTSHRFLLIASEAYRRRCAADCRERLRGHGPFRIDGHESYLPLGLRPFSFDPLARGLDLVDLAGSQDGRRVVLLGGPAAGKSTLLLRTASSLADRKTPHPILPVLLRLKSLRDVSRLASPQAADLHVLNLLVREISVAPYSWTRDDLRSAAAKGWCVFLLDGMDEITHEDYRLAVGALSRLCSAVPACSFVVAARTAGYRPSDDLPGFEAFEIQPIDPMGDDAGEFLRSIDALREYAGYFRLMLEREERIRSAVTTPLRLLIAAYVFRDQGGRVPPARLKLYDAASRSIEDGPKAGLPQETVNHWLRNRPEMCLRFLTVLATEPGAPGGSLRGGSPEMKLPEAGEPIVKKPPERSR